MNWKFNRFVPLHLDFAFVHAGPGDIVRSLHAHERVHLHAEGASVLHALELAALLGKTPGEAPADLLRLYPERLAEFTCDRPVQSCLFRDVA